MNAAAHNARQELVDLDQVRANQDLEDHHIRWLGDRGRFAEIAPLLTELVGPVCSLSIPIPAELRGDFQPSTPSVAMHDGDRRAIVRGVNYRQTVDQRTVFSGEGKDKCRTRNWWITFDDNWTPVTADIVSDPYPERPGAVQGYEDCRLFWSDGWKASCTFAERPKLYGPGAGGLLCEMALLDLDARGQIERARALRGPWSVYNQKNWRPAPTAEEPLRWVYNLAPLTLVTPEMASAPHSALWYAASPWRGSSQAVRLESGGWLWVDHRPIVSFDGPRHLYLHRFVLANDDLTEVKLASQPFVFQSYGIEFCSGLVVDGDCAVMSYSMKDATSLLAIVDLAAVLGTLEAVR